MTESPTPAIELHRGDVVWAAPDPAVGREQAGRRPAVVISSTAYLENVTQLAIVVPVSRVDRNWPNHVRLQGPDVGLAEQSFAMTEQPKTVDRRRIEKVAGRVDMATVAAIDGWLKDFLDLRE